MHRRLTPAAPGLPRVPLGWLELILPAHFPAVPAPAPCPEAAAAPALSGSALSPTFEAGYIAGLGGSGGSDGSISMPSIIVLAALLTLLAGLLAYGVLRRRRRTAGVLAGGAGWGRRAVRGAAAAVRRLHALVRCLGKPPLQVPLSPHWPRSPPPHALVSPADAAAGAAQQAPPDNGKAGAQPAGPQRVTMLVVMPDRQLQCALAMEAGSPEAAAVPGSGAACEVPGEAALPGSPPRPSEPA